MKPVRVARLSRDERREQLVDAATEVFSRADPAVVSLEELADAAGVSRALIYEYFGDRNGLIEAVYLRKVHVLNEAVRVVLASPTNRLERIRGAAQAHLDMALADPNGYRVVAGGLPFPGLAALEQARVVAAAGLFEPSPNATLIAQAAITTIQSSISYWLVDQTVSASDLLDFIVDFISAGILGVRGREPSYAPLSAN